MPSIEFTELGKYCQSFNAYKNDYNQPNRFLNSGQHLSAKSAQTHQESTT